MNSGQTPVAISGIIALIGPIVPHAQSPIVGIAPDPRRHLPRDLLRTAEHHLVLGDIDESAVALVIEAVTGQVPQRSIATELISAIDVSDLQLAVRKRQTPEFLTLADHGLKSFLDMGRRKTGG